jgi:hypothetical protein
MAARLFFRDSGGVARLLKRLFIRDSGGTTRTLKRMFIRDSGGVPRLVFLANYLCNFDITAAAFSNAIGYSNATPTGVFGTLNSASGFPPGTTLGGFLTYVAAGVNYLVLGINISADPGESVLVSFVYNGNTYTLSNVNSYGWEEGESQWTWIITSSQMMVSGDSYSSTATFTTAL